jgi:hypothetical protein
LNSLDTLDKNGDGSYEHGFHEAPTSLLLKQNEIEQTLQHERIAMIFPIPKQKKSL